MSLRRSSRAKTAKCGTPIALAVLALAAWPANAAETERPKSLDPRVSIELVAAEPQIVTPTGIAVDARGRVLVVESHTHFRPNNYQGPPADRIRRFEDTDGDGRADRATTFFEGTRHTMNLAVDREGAVFVATRGEVFRLREGADGSVAERTTLVRMQTKGDYPHNGLSGFAFDCLDWVYFGMGENLGVEFKLIGSDGHTISGQEGGHIFRCRPDGTKLQRWATGFWNPFHLALDTYDRLFAVDNDPDSMPPCRLLHVVEGGNYGYKFRNGRKGVHPFTAWNGELPGTLPMVAGTGEAPSGIVAYESDNLPEDFRGELLVTSWGDHRIDRFRLEPRGASFQSLAKPLIVGGENFRPVGIATAPDGTLYVSDWVDKSYEVHGKGRIWRIRAAEPSKVVRPTEPIEALRSADRPTREQAARELAKSNPGRDTLRRIAAEEGNPRARAAAIGALQSTGAAVEGLFHKQSFPALQAMALRLGTKRHWLTSDEKKLPGEALAEALRCRAVPDGFTGVASTEYFANADPFVQQAARHAFVQDGFASALAASLAVALASDPQRALPSFNAADQGGRAWASSLLLALRNLDDAKNTKLLPWFLRHPEPAVRFCAVQWVGEERLEEFRADLEKALTAGPVDGRLFSGYLAALERLDGRRRQPGDEWSPDQYLAKALFDERSPWVVKRAALRAMRPAAAELPWGRLRELARSSDAPLRLEAIRSLRQRGDGERGELLARWAIDSSLDVDERAEALLGLSPDEPGERDAATRLLESDNAVLRAEALRWFRGLKLSDAERARLSALKAGHAETAELVDRALSPTPPATRPAVTDGDAWLKLLEGPGDPAAGARLFHHPRLGLCGRCHQIDGRGGQVGPELTGAGRALGRRRLVESILQPSREIAPRFVPWLVQTSAGRTVTGMMIGETPSGDLRLVDERGDEFTVPGEQIEIRRPAQTSIMPERIAEQLTLQELRDLLSLLER